MTQVIQESNLGDTFVQQFCFPHEPRYLQATVSLRFHGLLKKIRRRWIRVGLVHSDPAPTIRKLISCFFPVRFIIV